MSSERLWPDGPLFVDGQYAKLTSDSILLADFAAASEEKLKRTGHRNGIDLGCGSGILCLLLLERLPKLSMTGLEIRPDAAALAGENLKKNGLEERSIICPGDLRETVKSFPAGSFDFVISNPPYYIQGESAGGMASPYEERAVARGELSCSLEELCRAAGRLCRSGGKLFLCYKPDRVAELFETLRQYRFEPKKIRTVHHRTSSRASLLLMEAGRDGRPGLTIEAPLLLHEESGAETEEYRKIFHRQ